MKEIIYPIRINKYLAHCNYGTRRSVEKLIEAKKVFINDNLAVLGDIVKDGDNVVVKGAGKTNFIYLAYNKPKGIVTHSPQGDDKSIQDEIGRTDVSPIGRLDKDSHGLIILTNDGRITDKLLNPEYDHDKEYLVKTKKPLKPSFVQKMEKGVNIEGYVTKPAKVTQTDDNEFKITLTEGKRHQIRRMVTALGNEVKDLKRTRILSIRVKGLQKNKYREISGDELKEFLNLLNIK